MHGMERLHDQLSRTHGMRPVLSILRQKNRQFSALKLPGRTDMNALERKDHSSKQPKTRENSTQIVRIHAIRGSAFSDGILPSREMKPP